MAATHLARATAPASQTPATPATAATPAMPAAHGDCHDMDTQAGMAPAAPASPSPMDGDCLERCLELCLQHGVATLPAATPMAHVADAAPAVSANATQLAHAHAFPPCDHRSAESRRACGQDAAPRTTCGAFRHSRSTGRALRAPHGAST